ncbi:MAG: hypothetical protein WDZ35_07245 [Crocinitomicaceae bacterium]
MKKLFYVATLILAVAVVSCSKDQRAVKKLDGTWEEVSFDGQTVPDSSKGQVTFTNCKLKKEEWCPATYTDSDGNSDTWDYKVTGDGTTLTYQVEDPNFGTFSISSTIDELTSDKLVLTTTFFGSTSTAEYKKI